MTEFSGALEQIDDEVAGWATYGNDGASVEVELFVNGKSIEVSIANQPAPFEGLNTKLSCGFKFNASVKLGDVIEVFVHNTNLRLDKCPCVKQFKGEPKRLGIAAIMKQEGPYLLEWIAYHRVMGVSRFFLADNDSSDETRSILSSLAEKGIVDWIEFPTPANTPPQMPALRKLFNRYSDYADFIAFIDLDEFIFPSDLQWSAAELITSIGQRPEVGSIALNWKTFGTNFQSRHVPGLVIERFTRRAIENFGPNKHVKHVVRTKALESLGGHPHIMHLKEGFISVDARGRELSYGEIPGVMNDYCDGVMKLNHYILKSEEEFWERKVTRGRAMTSSKRGQDYFDGHNRNEVVDDTALVLADRVYREMAELSS